MWLPGPLSAPAAPLFLTLGKPCSHQRQSRQHVVPTVGMQGCLEQHLVASPRGRQGGGGSGGAELLPSASWGWRGRQGISATWCVSPNGDTSAWSWQQGRREAEGWKSGCLSPVRSPPPCRGPGLPQRRKALGARRRATGPARLAPSVRRGALSL